MRIISGKYKGRRINPPNNILARPTTDFAREGLFNLLTNRIDFTEINTLDLFSGIGSISLELVSRGCLQATAIEKNEKHCAFIRKVCSDLDITNLNVIKGDVFKFIDKQRSQQYDFIFADPPYDLLQLAKIPDIIFSHTLLKKEGLFILEHSKNNNFEEHPNFIEQRRYGNVNFSFFKNRENEQ